jgi:tripartite-type tricarboxylate transporter receptor subunit TctC
MIGTLRAALPALATICALCVDRSQAQDTSFAGRTVTIHIGYGPGGGYDLYGRVLSRHLGRHLPGHPSVVVANMPGAGSIRAANYVYGVAPKDGTALGIVAQSIAEEQLLGTSAVAYDVTRFGFIGRFAANVEVTDAWHTAPVRALDDVRSKQVTVAGTGPSSLIYPRLLNSIAGMRWKVVAGYNTTAEAHLATHSRIPGQA